MVYLALVVAFGVWELVILLLGGLVLGSLGAGSTVSGGFFWGVMGVVNAVSRGLFGFIWGLGNAGLRGLRSLVKKKKKIYRCFGHTFWVP